MKRTGLYLLLLLLSMSTHAAWQPIVQNYSPRLYHSGTQNWQLAQAPSGWIYAANNYGVMEFDGQQWQTVGLRNSSIVRRIWIDQNGMILAGGTDEFGIFIPNEDNGLDYESLSERVPATYRPFGEVWGIGKADRHSYFQTRHYVFHCDSAQESIEVVDPGALIYASLLYNKELYLATSNGLFLYAGKRLHRLQGSEQLDGKTVCAMTSLPDGRILIGTDFHGIYQYNDEGIRPFTTGADAFLRRNQLYSIATDGQHLALGTVLMGLVLTDTEGDVLTYINREQGLQNNTVLSLLFDRDHNLWVGLDQGLDHISLNWPTEYLHEEPPYGVGYAYLSVDGDGYYATNQGLYYSRGDRDPLQFIDGSAGQTWRMCEIDSTLFCCHNRGLFEVKNDGIRTRKGDMQFELRKLDIPDGVWNVHSLRKNEAIACTYSGFYLLTKGRQGWQVKENIPGYDETVLYSILDSVGRLWAVSSNGYVCLEEDEQQHWRINRAPVDVPQALRDVAAQHFSFETPYGKVELTNQQLTMNGHNIFTRNDFFVGGFGNVAITDDGCYAVVGGVDGFFRVDLKRAMQPQISLPWAERPVKVIVPWYRSWWAWGIYILLMLMWIWMISRLIHHYQQARDARMAAEHEAEIHRQEMLILQLENDKAQFELKHKSQELNNALLERVNRNEIIAWVQEDLNRISDSLLHRDIETAQRYLRQLKGRLSAGNKRQEKDWQRFEDNFDAVNETFLSRLRELYPWMSEEQHKLCVYIYMGLQTKEIGPLLHLSTRGVEMMRYRMRKQMNLDDRTNLKQYFEDLAKSN